ncbi:MAG: hypothetical protein ACI8UO_000254 [Verrucomicrobiales bacterium]|jgi:hypothetical protein
MLEIYNYRIEDDWIYFVDRLVDPDTAAKAFKIFLDSALAVNDSISIREL